MKRPQLFRCSDLCNEKCIPKPNEDIYSHEDIKDIVHNYPRSKHINDHFKKYQNELQQHIDRILSYKGAVVNKITKIRQAFQLFLGHFSKQIDQYIQSFEQTLFDLKDRDIIISYRNDEFNSLTCKQMNRLLTITDAKSILLKQNEIQLKIEEQTEIFDKQFQACIKRIFQSHKLSVISISDKNLLNIINLNESSIQIVNNNESFPSQQLGEMKAIDDLFKIVQQKPMEMGKKKSSQIFQCQKQEQYLQVVEDEEDISYYQVKVQKTKFSKIEEVQNSLFQKSKMSTEFDSEEDVKQENEEQLNQTIRMFQKELDQNKPTSLQPQGFSKVIDLDEIRKAQNVVSSKFNMRVRIVKVLYQAVILNKIPKVKFIAGDQTGIAVFFTNYSRKIQAGKQLQLTNCHISAFKNSSQIINDKHFRVINEGKETLKANLQGFSFSQYIEKGMYYNIMDKNCVLIRYVGEKLASKNNLPIPKMTVKVMFILNQWENGVFCQVGDSSGLMLAYLRKDTIKDIKQGDVVKLLKPTGKKGFDPNKLIQQQIIYLDTYTQGSKVTPFNHEFLDVSDKIVAIQ